jgi:hypothetical protein
LLLEWYEASDDSRFEDIVFQLAAAPVEGLDTWRDGPSAIELIGKLRDGGYYSIPRSAELANLVENAAVDMIEQPMPSDELDRIVDAAEEWQVLLNGIVFHAIDAAIASEFRNVRDIVAEIDSDSTLNEHIRTLKKLAERASVSAEEVIRAVSIVEDRIAEIEEESQVFEPPSTKAAVPPERDSFDDAALDNLFAPLIHYR